jgi:predicted permease
MMILGLGLSTLNRSLIDWKVVAVTFSAKFIAWPLCAFTIVWLDRHYLKIYDLQMHKLLVVMASVPMVANSVAWAALFDSHPEKIAFAVLLSTLFVLWFLPFVVSFT